MDSFVFTEEQKVQFEKDGFLVLENFLSSSECETLKSESRRIVDEMEPSDHLQVFSTGAHEQMTTNYMLGTSDTIGFFWEAKAKDEKGNLLVPKHNALNKMGHALHAFSAPFKEVTFDEKMKIILRKLGYIRPVVPQSMVIFKPPKIGAEVCRHIDASFLFSDPLKLMGVWIALEDTVLENACLKFAPGSQKTTDVTLRMVRNPVKGASPFLLMEGSLDFLPFQNFVPVPVKKGSAIIIDGKVQHCSDSNMSDMSRQIYTFHVTESYKTVWSARNWLQPSERLPFPPVYDDSALQPNASN